MSVCHYVHWWCSLHLLCHASLECPCSRALMFERAVRRLLPADGVSRSLSREAASPIGRNARPQRTWSLAKGLQSRGGLASVRCGGRRLQSLRCRVGTDVAFEDGDCQQQDGTNAMSMLVLTCVNFIGVTIPFFYLSYSRV